MTSFTHVMFSIPHHSLHWQGLQSFVVHLSLLTGNALSTQQQQCLHVQTWNKNGKVLASHSIKKVVNGR